MLLELAVDYVLWKYSGDIEEQFNGFFLLLEKIDRNFLNIPSPCNWFEHNLVYNFRKVHHDKDREGMGSQNTNPSSEDTHCSPCPCSIDRNDSRFLCPVAICKITLDNLHEQHPDAFILDRRNPKRCALLDSRTRMCVVAPSTLLWNDTRCKSSTGRMEFTHIGWLLCLANAEETKVNEIHS